MTEQGFKKLVTWQKAHQLMLAIGSTKSLPNISLIPKTSLARLYTSFYFSLLPFYFPQGDTHGLHRPSFRYRHEAYT
jgi:hypothetical protein